MTNDQSDIQNPGWINILPPLWQHFAILARLDRPIGWWLLLIPGWQAILLAGIDQNISPYTIAHMMLLFLIGAIAMRGAGCVINDLWDRDLDRSVARTRNRPLASGAVSVQQAVLFLCFLGVIGLLILIQLPMTAIITGLASLPLIIIYPLAKRFTGLPQIVLALTFAWGALLGWASFGVWPNSSALILYLATALWIFGYDTIYAIQDLKDDAEIGIKSAALTLGSRLPQAVTIVYIETVFLLLVLKFTLPLGLIYLIGLGFFSMHLAYQIRRIDLTNPKTAGQIFKSNRNAGLILVAAIIGEYLIAIQSL